ncbi:MAG: protoporphyrinogen oxidase, partial [Ignavibacteriaceae bacterium]|nr:protoporphyrinogen oxidase [Ignavibacteriaceae bacterium]
MSSKKIVILGAGISGLTTAYLLYKKGYDVVVLEKKNEAGGSMESVRENGYLFDKGPNSALETTPLIAQLVEDLQLQDQLLYANKAADKRYILKHDKLFPLPMSPGSFLKTKLFSTLAKLRLFAEPFIGKSDDGYYQSIADFVKRRLGREFLDYAINPFVAGVYAGSPEELSVKSAFPKLYALEEKYGGLILGTIKSAKERKKRAEVSKQSARMLSFKDGMQVLPKAISDALGERVRYQCEVNDVSKTEAGYKVSFEHAGETESILCQTIISAIPSYRASEIFGKQDEKLAKHLNEIYYPPVLVLYMVYNKKDIGHPLDGFGFLIPAKEKKSFLGALWSSVIFNNRAEEDKAVFTLFVGGSRDADLLKVDKEVIIKKVKNEFEALMNIKCEPIFSSSRYWSKAIPQYNLGYIEHERYFEEFEKNNPGIILSGNYRGGISVGDCIKNAEFTAKKCT